MKIAFSPCPNNTFIFHALVHGLVPGAQDFDNTYRILTTNSRAKAENGPEVLKVSYAALPWAWRNMLYFLVVGSIG